MIKYAEEVKSGHGTKDEYMNDAMRWGSMCEDHAVATYINGMQCRKFEKTGLWVTTDEKDLSWLPVSPDGILLMMILLRKSSVLSWEGTPFHTEKCHYFMFQGVN